MHRTPDMIAKESTVDVGTLRDPQKDEERVKNPQWLVVLGVCTHLAVSQSLDRETTVATTVPVMDPIMMPVEGSEKDLLLLTLKFPNMSLQMTKLSLSANLSLLIIKHFN